MSLAAVPAIFDAFTKDAMATSAADVAALAVTSRAALVATLRASADNAKVPASREQACNVVIEITKTIGRPAEPLLLSLLADVVLPRAADGAEPVRKAAASAQAAVLAMLTPAAAPLAVTALLTGLSSKAKWQTKVAALSGIQSLVKSSPTALSWVLPEIIPAVSEAMGDVRAEVSKAAEATMADLCSQPVVCNRDIEAFVPALILALARPSEVPETIHKLSATTFVSAVEPPVLAVIVPILVRGLTERATAVKRKAAVIIENMAKLVSEPSFASPLLPKLLPGLAKLKDEVSDPECRNVAVKAHNVLLKAAGETDATIAAKAEAAAAAAAAKAAAAKTGAKPAAKGPGGKAAPAPAEPTAAELRVSALLADLTKCVAAAAPNALATETEVATAALTHAAGVAAALIDRRCFVAADWALAPYLEPVVGVPASTTVATAFHDVCLAHDVAEREKAADDEEGEELCNCEFSLAYGAKILLNTARLQLRRGKRYGLVGANGCGKSTLMRAISKGQVEGFPDSSVLRTVYVEHEIDGDASEIPVVEYVANDAMVKSHTSERKDVIAALESVGFDAARQAQHIGSLSGGWRMKVALARAMLTKPDIMLLDEPTNHLDVHNVSWLTKYLVGLTTVTCIIVSHDSSFLDEVCSHIIHVNSFKLKKYKGNLAEFVKVVPEAKSYYDLAAAPFAFTFPEPGFLEGVKVRDKAIIKMQNVTFTYPGGTKPAMEGVSIACSLASRIAVLGPNGAGKSTMIKLLTGELEPQHGTVWKHPALRIAYVAQHAFHHIEQNLDWTPSEYVQWRYATGEDRENASKASRQISAAEQAKMDAVIVVNGVKLQVSHLVSRRKLKTSFEYEVAWVGCPPDKNSYLPRKQLEEMGFGKMVDALDAREAAAAGVGVGRPLTAANIAKHLESVGLEPEFTLHSRMRGLSGGQKVKVVLGAAMWQNPQLLVLDEPTNFLDRDSLAALAGAIKAFMGGVVMISHHREFTEALCGETWVVDNGRLTSSGDPWAVSGVKVEQKLAPDEIIDAAGNVIKVVRKVKLTRQELKRKQKDRKERLKRGEEVSSEEEEEVE